MYNNMATFKRSFYGIYLENMEPVLDTLSHVYNW